MLTGPNVILTLKIAVALVTVLWIASLAALLVGRYRLHGRINLAFMVLTLVAVFGLEFIIRVYDPKIFDEMMAQPKVRDVMMIHLCFSIPSAILLPVMYVTGRTRRSKMHYWIAALFAVCWTGTFITGIFYLPHSSP